MTTKPNHNRDQHFDLSTAKMLSFCGNIIGYRIDRIPQLILPFEVEPTKGEHSFTKCKDCQKNLVKQTNAYVSKHDSETGFPLCCPAHENLLKLAQFKREFFSSSPEMVAKKIVYTGNHIKNNHDSQDGYRVITNYIDWVVDSFGEMPKDCGEPLYLSNYLNTIVDIVSTSKQINPATKTHLLAYLDSYLNPLQGSDLNILLDTYAKWLKSFPFAVNSYFGDLKEQFQKQIPLFNGNPETNPYSGKVTVRLLTKKSMLQLLESKTLELLRTIDAEKMVEQGVIPDLNKHKLELSGEHLRIATSQITKDFSSGELGYVKALKKWLKCHKEYFSDIGQLKALPPDRIKTRAEKLTAVFAKYGFLELPKVKILTGSKQEQLIELISSKPLAYSIAMLDYLEFFKHLRRNHFKTKTKLNKEVSKWFDSDSDGRYVKANLSRLGPRSGEKSTRYTADKHKETVEKAYNGLK